MFSAFRTQPSHRYKSNTYTKRQWGECQASHYWTGKDKQMDRCVLNLITRL